MNQVRSDLLPYNELWLDCVKNNLLSILINHDKSFTSWPLTFKTQYWKKLFVQKFPSEEKYEFLLSQGLFLPKVSYVNDQLYSSFHINKKFVQESERNTLHLMIREALQQQLYVFITVDRFYYPSGRESAKTHFDHPVFIHGYSDEENCYLAFEDCLTPGYEHPYQIPYDVIDSSANYFFEQNIDVEFRSVRINPEKISAYQFDITEETLANIFKLATVEEVVYLEHFELSYQVGISSLVHYSDEADDILSNLPDESMFALRANTFIQNHKKNSLLIHHLHSKGKANDQLMHLSELINDVRKKWEVFRNSILRKLQANNMTDLTKQKEYLKVIVDAEMNIASKMSMY